MSNFWATSTGGSAITDAKTEYDAGGGYDVIPDKSWVVAEIDIAEWDEDDDGNRFIALRWSVHKPESVANRKVFQKLWVEDDDPRAKDKEAAGKKRDKALAMLASIDANCGSKLGRKGTRPTSDDLALALIGKPMGVFLRVWEMNDNEGNWVAAIKPARSTEVKLGEPKKGTATGGGGGGMSSKRSSTFNDLDDDIPFITADSMF